MAKLTRALRDDIKKRIMAGVPRRNVVKEIVELIQQAVYDQMPSEVQAVYDNPDTRHYLKKFGVQVWGNGGGFSLNHFDPNIAWTDNTVVGLDREPWIWVDGQDHTPNYNSCYDYWSDLNSPVAKRLKDSGLVEIAVEQRGLIYSVIKRLDQNLAAASTTDALIKLLEPELRQFVHDALAALVPNAASVAPVVDELRKLGANL